MLVLLLGAGLGLENGATWEFRDDAQNSIWISAGKTSLPYAGRAQGRGRFSLGFSMALEEELDGHFRRENFGLVASPSSGIRLEFSAREVGKFPDRLRKKRGKKSPTPP